MHTLIYSAMDAFSDAPQDISNYYDGVSSLVTISFFVVGTISMFTLFSMFATGRMVAPTLAALVLIVMVVLIVDEKGDEQKGYDAMYQDIAEWNDENAPKICVDSVESVLGDDSVTPENKSKKEYERVSVLASALYNASYVETSWNKINARYMEEDFLHLGEDDSYYIECYANGYLDELDDEVLSAIKYEHLKHEESAVVVP